MPTYEYRCPNGHEFEQFVLRISEAAASLTCPTCGAPAPRRISAGGGLVFKGSGFYITDYGKDGKKDQRAKATKPSGDAAKATASDATAKAGDVKSATDTKPAAAPASTGGSSGASGSGSSGSSAA